MKTFVAIDFETATHDRFSACSLGVVRVIEGIITEQHYWLFSPPNNKYITACINVHGITPSMTFERGDITTIHNEIMRLLDGCTIVAHKADFDISVLENSLAYYGLSIPKIEEIHCTCLLNNGKKLDECCEKYNIQLDHHNALSDALACAKLFLILNGDKGTNYQSTTSNKKPLFINDPNRKIKSETLVAPDLSLIEFKGTKFFGKKVVITGIFTDYPLREELACLLKQYGADIQTSISSRTDIVIYGQGAGWAKMEKIQKLNAVGYCIDIMDEHQLSDYMKSISYL